MPRRLDSPRLIPTRSQSRTQGQNLIGSREPGPKDWPIPWLTWHSSTGHLHTSAAHSRLYPVEADSQQIVPAILSLTSMARSIAFRQAQFSHDETQSEWPTACPKRHLTFGFSNTDSHIAD